MVGVGVQGEPLEALAEMIPQGSEFLRLGSGLPKPLQDEAPVSPCLDLSALRVWFRLGLTHSLSQILLHREPETQRNAPVPKPSTGCFHGRVWREERPPPEGAGASRA